MMIVLCACVAGLLATVTADSTAQREETVARLNRALRQRHQRQHETGYRFPVKTFPFNLRHATQNSLELDIENLIEEESRSRGRGRKANCKGRKCSGAPPDILHSLTHLIADCRSEKLRKACYKVIDKKIIGEIVEVCRTPLVEDCAGYSQHSICRTLSEKECKTIMKDVPVENGSPECNRLNQECNSGSRNGTACAELSRKECTTENTVTERTTTLRCYEVPRRICVPSDCSFREGPVRCAPISEPFYQRASKRVCGYEPRPECAFMDDIQVLNPKFIQQTPRN